MSKRPSPFERKVDRIRELRDGERPGAAAELSIFVADREPYIAGFAAEVTAELGLRACIPDLDAALARTIAGEQPDGGCQASEKIARALGVLEAGELEVFRSGLGYVRREPVGPGVFVDRAIPVRIDCALNLARSSARQALVDLTPLLADPEPDVRAGVARAIALLSGDGPAAVLHLRVLAGDEPIVIGACLEGLLLLEASRYLSVAEAHLADEATTETAALALGESRLAAALPLLKRALTGRRAGETTSVILLSASLLRLPESRAWLAELVERGAIPLASQALRALSLERHAPGVAARVRAAVDLRADPKLAAVLADTFGDDA